MGVTANRRELFRGAGALALAGALGGCDAFAQGPLRPPNILFILADGRIVVDPIFLA